MVVGKSNLVGLPLSLLLLNENATVNVCNSYTLNLDEHARKADILISAAGRANLIKKNYVHKD